MVLKYENLNLYDDTNNNITIVGECHTNIEYENLICSIIEDIEPDGIAVESSTFINLVDGGISQSKIYASDLDVPLAIVDQNEKWMKNKLGEDKSDIILTANKYQQYVHNIGDITPRIVSDARNIIRDKFGEKAYQTLYTQREEYMGSRVNGFQDYVDGEVLLICGAFHVYALSEMVDISASYIEDNRILEDNYNIYNNTRW